MENNTKIYCILCGAENDPAGDKCASCGENLYQTENPVLDYIKEKFQSYVKDTLTEEGQNAFLNWLSKLLNSWLYGIALSLTLLVSASSILAGMGGEVKADVTEFTNANPIFTAPQYNDGGGYSDDLVSMFGTKYYVVGYGRQNSDGSWRDTVIRLSDHAGNYQDATHEITVGGVTYYSTDVAEGEHVDIPFGPSDTVAVKYTDSDGKVVNCTLTFYPSGALHTETIDENPGKNPNVITYREDGTFISQYIYDPNAITGEGPTDVYRLHEYDENNYCVKISYYYFDQLHHYITYDFSDDGLTTTKSVYLGDGTLDTYTVTTSNDAGQIASSFTYKGDGTMIEGTEYAYGSDGSMIGESSYKNGKLYSKTTYGEGGTTEYFQ